MKIVCDACSAKYSISDDKVQGKVFKIRCKKCSNIIVVRGTASAAAPAEPSPQEKDTRVFDYGYDENSGAATESVWHVVIDQDQVGPLSVPEVQKRFSAGEIDADTYIWREGFADWLPISQVEAFASLFGGATSAGDDSGALFGGGAGGGAAAVNDLFGGGDSAGNAGAAAGDSDDDGDVFSARRSSPQAVAAPKDDGKLRGERGENSVLFSLSNLAQLASDSPRPQQSSSSSSSGSAQHGGGEGSGLIDIRSMANAYLAPDKGNAKSASPSLGSAADLPVFSSSGFGESAVIMPIVRSSASNNNKLIYGLVGMVGVLAVIAVVMVVFLLKDSKPSATEAVALNSTTPTTPTPGTEATTPTTPTTPTPGTEVKTPTTPTEATTPDKPRDPGKRPSDRDTGKKQPASSGSSGSGKTTGSTKPPPEEEKPKPTPKGGDCDAVTCLVDPNAPCCKKGGPKPSGGNTGGSKPDSSLPEQLDASMIKTGIDKVKGRAQACGSKSSAKGAVKVRIKAQPDGKVGSVDVLSTPDDSLGSCVASALKGASFPKTQRGMGFAYTLSF